MSNTNKYNYYITLINMCNSLDDADRLTFGISTRPDIYIY